MVRVCGAWIGIYYVLCSKIYSPYGDPFWIPAGSRRATRGARICETRLLHIDQFYSLSMTCLSISIKPALGRFLNVRAYSEGGWVHVFYDIKRQQSFSTQQDYAYCFFIAHPFLVHTESYFGVVYTHNLTLLGVKPHNPARSSHWRIIWSWSLCMVR